MTGKVLQCVLPPVMFYDNKMTRSLIISANTSLCNKQHAVSAKATILLL